MVYLIPEFLLVLVGAVGLVIAFAPSRPRLRAYSLVGGLTCFGGAVVAGYLAYLATTDLGAERHRIGDPPARDSHQLDLHKGVHQSSG